MRVEKNLAEKSIASRAHASIAIFLAALVISIAASPVLADTLERIRESNTLRLGYFGDARPFSYRTKSGTVDGYAAKDRRNAANARMVTLPDGRKLFGGFQSTPGNPFQQAVPEAR